MTKEQQELLSAYFDGAAIDDRTLESLLDDEEVMKEFATMSEIRAGLRDEILEGIDFAALSDAVALEVSREPALQPRAANDEDAVPSSEAARAQKSASAASAECGMIWARLPWQPAWPVFACSEPRSGTAKAILQENLRNRAIWADTRL